MVGKGWTEDQRVIALKQGPYKSVLDQNPFLRREFASMVAKGQWVEFLYLRVDS